MTRDGLVEVNETQQTAERISKRTQDAELQKTPEQQAAQDAAQLQGAASPTSPLPHVPGAAPKADTGKTERVMEHIEAAHTRKASKKAVRKAQAEATAGTKSSRLQFTDEERAAPELEKYIKKSDKAADRLDKAKAAIPKEKKLVKERTFDETTGKGKTRLHFEEKDKPPGFKEKHNPLSRPTQEAGILVHNKIHSVEKDNSGVEGAHKSEESFYVFFSKTWSIIQVGQAFFYGMVEARYTCFKLLFICAGTINKRKSLVFVVIILIQRFFWRFTQQLFYFILCFFYNAHHSALFTFSFYSLKSKGCFSLFSC